MVAKRLYSVVFFLQVTFTMTWSQGIIDICDCKYRFVEQPPNSIMCNPYPTGQFVTRCTVDYSTSEGLPLNIIWHSREHHNSPSETLTSNIDVSTNIGTYSVQSVLTIPLTVGLERTYENYRYFCSVSFMNGTALRDSTSQEVYIFPRSSLTGPNPPLDYPDCDDGGVQSVPVEKCIDPNYGTTTPPPPTPPTTPPTTPPPTTTEMITTTTTPSPPPPPPETTTPPPPPPETTTPPPPPPPPPETTTPPPPPPPITTTTPPVSATRNPFTFEEEILLYSSIVAAVILVVIIVVLILCLCCWNRVCQRSRYCTCYSKY